MKEIVLVVMFLFLAACSKIDSTQAFSDRQAVQLSKQIYGTNH